MNRAAHPSPPRRRSRVTRAGLSLFEIMLALVILGLTLAALAPLESRATRVALRNRLETEAQLRGQAILRESLARGTASLGISQTCADDPRWTYHVDVLPQGTGELVAVRAVVERAAEHESGRVRQTVVQLVRRELIEQRDVRGRGRL